MMTFLNIEYGLTHMQEARNYKEETTTIVHSQHMKKHWNFLSKCRAQKYQ